MTNPSSTRKKAKRIDSREQEFKNFQNIERQKHVLSGLRPEKDQDLQSLKG